MTSTNEIIHDMDRTRDEIRATLAAIERRLSVENVVQHVVAPTRDHAMEYGRIFSDAVRANPLALGVAAVGIGWLMLGSRKPAGKPGNGEIRLDPGRIGEQAGEASTAIGAAARDAVRSVKGATRETAEAAASRVRTSTEGAASRLSDVAGAAASRLGDAASKGRSRAAETLDDASAAISEAASKGRSRAAETLDDASAALSDAASKGRDALGDVSGTIRGAADDAYKATRRTVADMSGRVRKTAVGAYETTCRTAAGVPDRVRDTADSATTYVREHPVAAAAALAVGGAALALLVARRSSRANGSHEAVEAVSESGGKRLRPLTPEDVEDVYVAGDVSAAAIRREEDDGSDSGAPDGAGDATETDGPATTRA